MNYLPPSSIEKDLSTFSTDAPINVLSNLFNSQENSCLQIIFNSTTFFLHFNEGKLVYATNSLAPFERLERHLRRLGNSNPQLDNEIIKQPRSQFSKGIESYSQFPSDYQGIIWLTQQGYLKSQQGITAIRRVTREVFESLLCISDSCQYKFIARIDKIPELYQFDLKSYVTQCQKRIDAWQAFSDKIGSSYQRPYLVTEKVQAIANLSTEQNKTICQLLKGLNFRQISAILDLDELAVAKILYPSMLDNTIVVRDPKSPFDLLPSLPQKDKSESKMESKWRGENSGFLVNSNSEQTVVALEQTWKIACVDEDTSAHNDYTQYLDRNLFSTLLVDDPLNAFSELIGFEPNLIILKTNMPHLSGYELSTLLRNHQDFKATPIILVHEVYEPIDTFKFKRSGATESINKPFERTKLLNLLFKYLQ